MALRHLDRPGPIEAVLFDFHSTLVDQGDPARWFDLAWVQAGRKGTAREALGEKRFLELSNVVNRIWEHVTEIDPHNERDLSPRRHREVFDAFMARLPGVDDDLARALYEVMLETWIPYDDALPTLRELKRRGIKIALVSNIGRDVRGVLERGSLSEFFDAVILSCEVGSLKPSASIFEQALSALRTAPAHALMVGDNPRDDAGAALIGIRTLLLPRTAGLQHGLEIVLRLVGSGPRGGKAGPPRSM
ncbi:MAG TPA: HAD family hydrolase [Anaeromyxobacteraceae bacterium]|nr:HAD family hydrolase [Anaeromyxobacteraceae bacterium]